MARRFSLELNLDSIPTKTNSSLLTESGTFCVGDFKINANGFTYNNKEDISVIPKVPVDNNNVDNIKSESIKNNKEDLSSTDRPTFNEPLVNKPKIQTATPDLPVNSISLVSPHLPSLDFTSSVQLNNILSSRTSFSTPVSEPYSSERDKTDKPITDLSEFKTLSNLGQGISGTVKHVIHVPSGREYALKVINVPFEADVNEKKLKHMITELKTLHQSECKHIVGFNGAFFKEGAIYLVLEHMDGSLADTLKLSGTIPEKYIAHVAKQVLLGLNYLHTTRRLIHRDIKPSNILIKGNIVKLADFGVSGQLDESTAKNSFVGTVTYMSPERINGKPHSMDSDIWSLGLTLAECALGRFPYMEDETATTNESNNSTPRNSEGDNLPKKKKQSMSFWMVMDYIVSSPPPTLPNTFSVDFRSFVSACLQKEPSDRLSVDKLLEHPFITNNNVTDFAEFISNFKTTATPIMTPSSVSTPLTPLNLLREKSITKDFKFEPRRTPLSLPQKLIGTPIKFPSVLTLMNEPSIPKKPFSFSDAAQVSVQESYENPDDNSTDVGHIAKKSKSRKA